MMKKEDNPMVKNYAYGGRVAAGSMEKPEKQMQEGGMVMKPREPYTTAEEERKRKEEAMSFMPSIMKRMLG